MAEYEDLRNDSTGEHPDIATFDQRFPRAVMQGLGVGNAGPSMDSAFSGNTINDKSKTEFALAKGLREKAKGMK